ncbi:aromatic amino acid transaminase [Marinospirillum alkaliphilum]|uniref:Aminotransferase n=1 Tax=Marinospirillum alkaliphilum DSM 21637 TaxID=1122209 RepID=A0A1K1U438_9GAMM|nr:amino acid aminotransferase [Marinospirillum alkaliphilum]SFX07614.1 aromatic amino acid aminotransferase apoenzyme [Marinospirillum alkaliphilum DSM 21637]
MFGQVELLPADPILGLIEAFNRDTNPNKIDLGVGVYRDAQGNTPILQAVKEAEALLLTREKTKSYIGSHGDPAFGQQLLPLVLGQDSAVLQASRATLTQAPGGTGALRLAADFIHRCAPGKKVWISDPTWPNHYAIFNAAGVEYASYRYVDSNTNRLDFPAMLADLQQIPEGDVVLLHACCHNPTGFDLSLEQWQQVLEILKARKLLPLIDFAYQGFGAGLEEDAAAVRLLAEQLPEVMITASCSKNFGLYRERIGAFIAVAANRNDMEKVRSQLAVVARSNYSNPPAHGSAIVATILANPELNGLWRREVDDMRNRINTLRQQFVDALKPFGLAEKFACVAEQRGMFSYSGLKPEEVQKLQQEFGIYMVKTGRMNIAGYSEQNLQYLCKAIASVCGKA